MSTPLCQVGIILQKHPDTRGLSGKDGFAEALILTIFLCSAQFPLLFHGRSFEGHCPVNFFYAHLCPVV